MLLLLFQQKQIVKELWARSLFSMELINKWKPSLDWCVWLYPTAFYKWGSSLETNIVFIKDVSVFCPEKKKKNLTSEQKALKNTKIVRNLSWLFSPLQPLSPCSISGCWWRAQTSTSSTRGRQKHRSEGHNQQSAQTSYGWTLNQLKKGFTYLFTWLFSSSLTIQPFLKLSKSGCKEIK